MSNEWEKLFLEISVGATILLLSVYGFKAVKYQTFKLRYGLIITGSRAKKLGYFFCVGAIILAIALVKFIFE